MESMFQFVLLTIYITVANSHTKLYLMEDESSMEKLQTSEEDNVMPDLKQYSESQDVDSDETDYVVWHEEIPNEPIKFGIPEMQQKTLLQNPPRKVRLPRLVINKIGNAYYQNQEETSNRKVKNVDDKNADVDFVIVTDDSVGNLTNQNAESEPDFTKGNFRRVDKKNTRQKVESDETTDESSSSKETQRWKEKWKQFWLSKKMEALNSSHGQKVDQLGMLAARPWGVSCGGPSKRGQVVGTCTLGPECDSEFRIYAGDYYCRDSMFVCCAIQQTDHDLYQGFDLTFDMTDVSTEFEEMVRMSNDSNKEERKKHARVQKEHKRAQIKRKIKKKIAKVNAEISKIIAQIENNATQQKKRKTKLLKRFLMQMQRQFKNDKLSLKELHNRKIVRIDNELFRQLLEMKALNEEFLRNSTFREIILHGRISEKAARMLGETYPKLLPYLPKFTRRKAFIT